MGMTESEVAELVAEVGDVDWEDPVVRDWLQAQLEAARGDEKRLRAAFTIQKLMRQDERMNTVLRDLRQTRQAIETMEGFLNGKKEG